MIAGFWAETEVFLLRLLPILLCLLLILFNLVNYFIPGSGEIRPILILAGIYYWTIYRPDLMPYWAVFVLGLVMDLLYGGILGLSSFVLLFMVLILASQRKFFFKISFVIIWWAYMICAFGVALCHVLLNWLLIGGGLDGLWQIIIPVFFSTLISIALYPFLHRGFVKIQGALPMPRYVEMAR